MVCDLPHPTGLGGLSYPHQADVVHKVHEGTTQFNGWGCGGQRPVTGRVSREAWSWEWVVEGKKYLPHFKY